MARESDFLHWLRRRLPAPDPSVLIGPGPDDCAFVRPAGGSLAVTTDTLLEGTHFTPDAPPRAVGWKALAVNLSDLAASGCCARWFTLALGLRRGAPPDWAEQFIEGLLDCAARHRVDLVGGDTTSGAGPASITVTAFGEPLPGGPLPRAGARPGDILAVTGQLGGSLRGRHLHPEPRLVEIAALLEIARELAPPPAPHALHAAMDLSDGLALDAGRLLGESGLGAVFALDDLPVSPDADAADPGNAWRRALTDGEDFELLLAVAPEAWPEMLRRFRRRVPATPLAAVGVCRAEPGLVFQNRRGEPVHLDGTGYEHAW